MQPGPPRRRHARPVGGAPIDELLGRSEDLAKGWLLALLEQAPLDTAPALLATDLVRDGPRLCEAAVRALADDRDLRRIEPGGALELLVSQTGRLAGTSAPEGVLRAVEALQGIIWSALRDQLGGADPDLVADLAQRLARVMDCIRAAALRGAATAPEPLHVVQGEPAEAPQPLWIRALEEEILQAERTKAPLSLLLVELEDADRLLAVERLERAGATFGGFAQALRTVLRQRDLLARETDGRAWIIARATARAGAQALGERIAEAVGAAEPWRGAPLSVTVGVAVLGEDGQDRATLVEAAEENRFAAAAQGVSMLLRADLDQGESGEPEV
jgi:GGDEF domain-containing protein